MEKQKLERLIHEAAYDYKGLVYCDGIVVQQASILPKTTDYGTSNASC